MHLHLCQMSRDLQTAAQTHKQNALAKLAELEGVLQQALNQRAQASDEAGRVLSQLKKESAELAAAQQQLQQQRQELAGLQVIHTLACPMHVHSPSHFGCCHSSSALVSV